MKATALILAAGMGTRMKSSHPKVVHEVIGRPLVRWPIEAAKAAGCERIVCVLGHGRDEVAPLVEDTQTVIQEPQLGTGHAVMCARDAIGTEGSLLVLSGDAPLIRPDTLENLVRMREGKNAGVVVLTMIPANPGGYGRIIRDEEGSVSAIVESKDCTPEQTAIRECNSGIYCFDIPQLLDALDQLTTDNAQGEYYLTDCIELIRQAGGTVAACICEDDTEALGVNSRAQLAQVTGILQKRINDAHMAAGVTMWDPAQTWIGPDVRLAQDVELLPQTYLLGNTTVATGSVIGPNTRLTDTTVAENCRIDETVAYETVIEKGVTCGPRAYLRPGAHLLENAHIGTHVEIKKSTVGVGSKVPHLSYIGDTTIGAGVNIGAGSITCNYDGVNKHSTHIGDGAFIGSDTMLVAPVSVGAGAIIGAGSTITKDVPADALGIERSKQRTFENWARKRGVSKN